METTTTDATKKRTKVPPAAQASLMPENPPKPNGMTPATPKHNAELGRLEVEGKIRKIELLSASGGKTRVKLHLVAEIEQGMPKTIQAAADGLWKAAGSVDGECSTHMSLGRSWAVQLYRFEVPKAVKIKDGPSWECEVVGKPKVSIVGNKERMLSWAVECRVGLGDLKILNHMLEAQDFVLTTEELQTQIH